MCTGACDIPIGIGIVIGVAAGDLATNLQRLSIISIGIGIAIGIGIEFGRAWLIRLRFFQPTVFDADADHDAEADSGENRQSLWDVARATA